MVRLATRLLLRLNVLVIRPDGWLLVRLMPALCSNMQVISLARNRVLSVGRCIRQNRTPSSVLSRPRTARSSRVSRPFAARHVGEIFFPQRIPLRIDGGSASPAVLVKKALATAFAPSYAMGELVLRKIGDIDLTGRGL